MIFLWYPACFTCKRVKELLDKKNVSYQVRDIKIEKPTKEELLLWTTEENIHTFFNTSGLVYKRLGLKDKMNTLSYLEKVELLSKDGMLVKRPILVDQEEVLVGPKQIEKKYNA